MSEFQACTVLLKEALGRLKDLSINFSESLCELLFVLVYEGKRASDSKELNDHCLEGRNGVGGDRHGSIASGALTIFKQVSLANGGPAQTGPAAPSNHGPAFVTKSKMCD